jgi:ribose 5-phosphate isomerase A
MTVDQWKAAAAAAAVELIRPGMVVGLGFGSTAAHAVQCIGEKLQRGELSDIVGVPCAEGTAQQARRLGIPLVGLDDVPAVDLTIDGADEVDPQLNLIKGGGGALLREKMVAQASRRLAIIVDAGKLSGQLGSRFYLPIEVVEFGAAATARWVSGLGGRAELRRSADGRLFRTDQGQLILDWHCGPLADAAATAALLSGRAGIVEHGLFIGMADEVFAADAGGVRRLQRRQAEAD